MPEPLGRIVTRRLLMRTLIIIMILAISGGAVLAYLGGEADALAIQQRPPGTILAHQPFEVVLDLENTTNDDLEIVSVGIENALLNSGIRVNRMTPSYRTYDEGSRWTELVFSRRGRPLLAPGESTSLTIQMVASKPGQYQGDITIWYENQLRSDAFALNLSVSPHPMPWLGR
ncbi:MAG: hypothetical protein GYB66_12830 [Chloroflexi bacterium]|nr:hypothetical protein [Chloroflexota bacterium]